MTQRLKFSDEDVIEHPSYDKFIIIIGRKTLPDAPSFHILNPSKSFQDHPAKRQYVIFIEPQCPLLQI